MASDSSSPADRAYYDKGVATEDIAPFVDDVRFYFDAWAKDRRRWFGNRTGIRALELGAGSCTVSYLLSQEPWVSEVVACDISLARSEQFQPYVESLIGADLAKLQLVEADFNVALPFPDNSFDLVVMDSALHHSRSIWLTLAEVNRVLKSPGYFVAQREHYLAPLTSRWKMRRMLESDEVQNGVSENAYFREQYEYYLRANGLRPRFSAVLPSRKFRALAFLNGLAFSKYNIVASKAAGSATA